MSKRSLLVALCLAFGLSSATACVVHTRERPARGQKKVKRQKRCKPSQYWDGHRCRHKGKGKGARKHDGPRRR